MQRLLREAVAGTLPDVALFGLNRRRILEARGLTRPLGPLMAGMDADAEGCTDALLSLGQFAGAQHALAAPASTLVACLDPDLVAQAGHDADPCPQSLDDLITLGDDIDGIRIDRREWRFRSLPGARGGRPMTPAESDITFERHAGVAAAKLCQVFARHAGMPGYIDDQARKACPAGDPGIMMGSSSLLTRFDEAAGDRVAVTMCALPIAAKPRGVYFPTLGSTLVMLTDDPEKPQAAGDYTRFVAGPGGARLVVENTGYAPANTLVLRDEAHPGAFHDANPDARSAHGQVAAFAGPRYACPGAEGVAVTDLIAEELWEIRGGEAAPKPRMPRLGDTVRTRRDME